MRNVLRLAFALSGASLVGTGMLLACSSDTSVNASTDAGVAPPGPDAPFDSTPTPTDSSPPTDAGFDTAPPFDGGFVVDTFDGVIATELCKALARCCYGTPTPAEGGADGGTFDLQACMGAYGRVGFEGSNADSPLKDGGKVLIDQTSADSCITKIKAMSCDLPGSEFKAIRTACFGAYSGSVAAAGGCVGSIECQQGLFCKTSGDAGSGVCTALRATNGPCGDFDPNRADEACSYRAGGNTGDYCRSFDVTSGNDLDAGDWKCLPAGPVDSGCGTSLWCDQSICNDNSICQTPDMYFASACGLFAK